MYTSIKICKQCFTDQSFFPETIMLKKMNLTRLHKNITNEKVSIVGNETKNIISQTQEYFNLLNYKRIPQPPM